MSSMDHIKEPIFCDEPFSKSFPIPPQIPCCCRPCIAGQLPKIRGIPTGSVPLSAEETKEILKLLEGNWKITPLEGATGTNAVTYEDVMVRDDYYVMSGGMHNATVHSGGHGDHSGRTHQVAQINRTLKEHFHFHRGPNQEIYMDYIGSTLSKLDAASGEVELNNALGISCLWQRGWKKDGLPPPQQQMAPATVVSAQVVGTPGVPEA